MKRKLFFMMPLENLLVRYSEFVSMLRINKGRLFFSIKEVNYSTKKYLLL